MASTPSATKQEVSSEICHSMDALKLRHLAWQESVEVGMCVMMFQTSFFIALFFVFQVQSLEKKQIYGVRN